MYPRLLLFAILFLSLSLTLPAQTAQQEVGLRASGLQDYDFLYKRSLGVDRYLRIRVLTLSSQFNTRTTGDSRFLAFATATGIEWHRNVSRDAAFVHGPEIYAAGSVRSFSELDDWTIDTRLGYVLGFNYYASERFVIGVEAIPQLTYSFGENAAGQREESFGGSFSTTSVALTALYRISSEDE